MGICKKIEDRTGLSGHAIAKKLGISASQWYRWQDRKDWAVKWRQLEVLAELVGGWEDLGNVVNAKRRAKK